MPPGAILAAMRSGPAGRAGRSRWPRPGPSPRRPGRRSTARRRAGARTGASSSRRPLWTMPSQGTSGWVDAWLSLMATSPRGASRRSGVGPRQVEPAVEGRDDRDRRDPREEQARPLEVRVDRGRTRRRPVDDLAHGQLEPRGGVPQVAGRAEGLGDRGDEPPRHDRVAGREGRHLVAAPVELVDEAVDDALGPAVGERRDALQRRSDLGDAKGTGHARYYLETAPAAGRRRARGQCRTTRRTGWCDLVLVRCWSG